MKLSSARLSLRAQLVLWYSVAIVALFGILFLTLNQFLSERLTEALDDSLVSQAGAVDAQARLLGATTLPEYGQALRAASAQTARSTGRRVLYARLVAPDGAVAATAPGSFDGAPPPIMDFDPEEEAEFRVIRIAGPGNTRVYVKALFGSDGEFLGHLEIAESYRTIEQALAKLRSTLLWQGLAGAFLALGVGYLVARRGLKPLDKVVALANEIHDKNLLVRVPKELRPKEIQELVDSFNDLLERLGSAFERERLFSAGVSHELRTPLAALRTQLEVLQMDPDIPAELRLKLVALESEVVRLIQLSSNLLLLAQLEAGSVVDRKPVDLVELLHEVYRETQLLAGDRRLVMTQETPCIVDGDRSLLKQVFLNLMSNAIKFTEGNGRIQVSVQTGDGKAKVIVADNGSGIPEPLKSKLLEPFASIDQRGRGTHGGAGLGLAISKRILSRHNGDISFESSVGVGTMVSVVLPLASVTEPVA